MSAPRRSDLELSLNRHLYGNTKLYSHRRVNVDFFVGSMERNNQRIPSFPVPAAKPRPLAPPADHRKDTNQVTGRDFRCRALPNIGMDGAGITAV